MAKRLKTFHLSPQQVAQGFDHSGPPHVTVQGLPDGHKIEFCDFCGERGTFRFVVSHDSFPEVPEGEAPEELQIALILTE